MTWTPEEIEAAGRKALEGAARKSGLPYRAVLFLVIATALLTFAGRYALKWWLSPPASPSAALVPVPTQGGGTAYTGPPTPAMAKKKPRATVTIRPVATIPTADLPPEESAALPSVAPAVGLDNVQRGPELADTVTVPPARGDTYVRAVLLPDGRVEQYLDPQKERFLSWEWKRVELEGGYGIGGKQVDLSATWLPLRLGNVHLGAKGETWTEMDGTIKGAGSIRFRWEPFRGATR